MIATGLRGARRVVIVNSAAALVAIGGGHGTLSEIACATVGAAVAGVLRTVGRAG